MAPHICNPETKIPFFCSYYTSYIMGKENNLKNSELGNCKMKSAKHSLLQSSNKSWYYRNRENLCPSGHNENWWFSFSKYV